MSDILNLGQRTVKMKLYHGTTDLASEGIDSQRIISSNAQLFYPESHMFPTEPGFVYLTNNPGLAAYMGNKNAILAKRNFYSVYEVELPESMLLPDFDELQYVGDLTKENALKCSLTDSLRLVNSCRVNKDLEFVTHVKRKFSLGINSHTSNLTHRKLTQTLIHLRDLHQVDEAISTSQQCEWLTLT